MQTSINEAGQPAGSPGDIEGDVDTASGFSEEASAEIEFGSGVDKGTAERGAIIPTASGGLFLGVVQHSHDHHQGEDGDLGDDGLKPDAGFAIVQKGKVALKLDVGVTTIAPYSDRGFLRYASNGGNTVKGRWGKATDAGNRDLTTKVLFISSVRTAPDGTLYAMAMVDVANE